MQSLDEETLQRIASTRPGLALEMDGHLFRISYKAWTAAVNSYFLPEPLEESLAEEINFLVSLWEDDHASDL